MLTSGDVVELKAAVPAGTRAIELDRSSPLPLYAQVAHRLQAMIARGDYPSGRFYSEGELCAMFDVSRATVRQAVRRLSDDGLLSRQRGTWTSVNRERFDEAFNPSMNLPEQWARSGRPLHLTLMRFELTPCTAEIAAVLGVRPKAHVLYLERVRSDPGGPVSYDFRYIHPDFAHSIGRDEATRESLLDLLQRRIRIKRGDNKLEAALAGDEGERLLHLDPASPMLVRETVYYSSDSVAVMCGRSLYPAKRIRCAFSVDLSVGEAEAVSHVRMDDGAAGRR